MFRAVGAVGGAVATLALIRASTVKANQDEGQKGSGNDGTGGRQLKLRSEAARNLGGESHTFSVTTDSYQPKLNFERTPTATRHLILVRNGQDGEPHEEDDDEAGLTSLGRKQATFAGRRLYDLGMPYTKIVHSGMRNAAETSHIIASYLLYVRREYDGDLRTDAMAAREKSTEPGHLVQAVVDKYLGAAPSQQVGDSFVVVVCDEDVLKGLLCRAMGLHPDWAPRLLLYHGSVSILAIHPNGEVIIKAVGDTGYMTKDIMTLRPPEAST